MSRPATRSVRCNRMIVRAAVSQTALRTQALLQFAYSLLGNLTVLSNSQDTAKVLEDVRKIIAEQLGTDQDKVTVLTICCKLICKYGS